MVSRLAQLLSGNCKTSVQPVSRSSCTRLENDEILEFDTTCINKPIWAVNVIHYQLLVLILFIIYYM